MVDFIIKGGYLILPILLCSVIAVAITIERFINLREDKVIPKDFFNRIKGLLLEGHINEVLSICSKSNKPIAKIIEAGIMKYYFGRDEIKEAIEDAGRHEIAYLEKYLIILSTIAGITPLLGLLGTVWGMIKVFNVISMEGIGQADKLAGGISEALITTAAGLVVAIPTLVFHNFFAERADRLILKMEKSSMELTEILSQGQRDEWKV
ncbi:MAG: MotA/TolQ/ExbB proton channel family protein [bacterium]|nr:MotA/TolQ/ExbB proton channel family protein [bacterium]